MKDMSEEELNIAREIGKKVGLGLIKIECPICTNEPPREGQLLSSYGDQEELLFCPGCGLGIFLKVMGDNLKINEHLNLTNV